MLRWKMFVTKLSPCPVWTPCRQRWRRWGIREGGWYTRLSSGQTRWWKGTRRARGSRGQSSACTQRSKGCPLQWIACCRGSRGRRLLVRNMNFSCRRAGVYSGTSTVESQRKGISLTICSLVSWLILLVVTLVWMTNRSCFDMFSCFE